MTKRLLKTTAAVQLRRSYHPYPGKPQNITEAIRKYNSVRQSDNKKILNSEDFFQQMKEIMETDLPGGSKPKAPMIC